MSAPETQCPVCSKANLCQVANDENASDCWCKNLSLEAELKSHLAQQYDQTRCICENCIRTMNATFVDAAKPQ